MVDLPKANTHISFISNLDQLKSSDAQVENEHDSAPEVGRPNLKVQQEVLRLQSENKQ